MGKDVTEAVRKWLLKSGYPLELYVGRQFGKAGFQITHSTHYSDPLTGQMREVDLLASFQKTGVNKTTARSFTVTVTFIVECKKSDKPWVVFLSAREDQQSPPDGAHSIFTWPMNATAKAELADRLAVSWNMRRTVYEGINHGHSIVSAFGGVNIDRAHQAVQQVLSATSARLDQIGKAGEPYRAHVLLPVVVVDGRLFEAHLDDAHDLALHEVFQSVLVLKNQTSGLQEPRTLIVTKQAMPEFVRVAIAMAQGFAGIADAIVDQGTRLPV
ncbi:MAG TPA: hypothetical protein VN970_06825 [Thermoanaerobaculia bacterium]|nr:hypothetical protein [Thermoanaerobaculia bacterium]